MISSCRFVRWSLAVALLVACPGVFSSRAEGLKSAQVSRIFNDVKLLPENQSPRAAAVADTISGKSAVQTGAGSRTELMFQDKTLTRLGANSYFSFVNGTRDMNLGSGTMLLQVPKGAGGAEIHTAAVTAAITGTTLMVEFNPKSYSKIIVLEGTVRVFLTKRIGESVLVHAGQMVIVPPGSASMPEPVGVDLKVLYATSGLINDFGPVASRGLIDREITKQRKDIDGGRLADTDLFIVGRGTEVQTGHLSFVSADEHNITARQGAHSPLGLNETRRVNTEPPAPPTPPAVTPTPPVVRPTPTPPVVTPTPTPPVVTPTPTPPVVTPTPTPPVVTPTPTPGTPTPTPVPTATPPPTPTPTPTPSPSPSVSPTPTPPPPTPSKFGALPVIANNNGGNGTAYAIDGTSAIRTDPFITTQGVQDEGRIYRGGTTASPATTGSVDGLPSLYFLGAANGPTLFDAQTGFDSQVGTLGNVGGFKFNTLALLGNPASISTVDGPTSLVFVAVDGITDSNGKTIFTTRPGTTPRATAPTGATFDLRGLDNVLFVTQNGPITLTNGLAFTNGGSTATALTLYARGGDLTVGGGNGFTLPGSALNLFSDNGIQFAGSVGSTDAAGAGAVNLISAGATTVSGLLHSTGDLNATTTTATGDLVLVGGSAVTSDAGNFNANSGGRLDANGLITTGGSVRLIADNGVGVIGNITAGANIRLRANAGDLTTDAGSVFQAPGTFTATATTGSLAFNGTVGGSKRGLVTPTSANLTAGVSLTLAGTVIATDSVAVTGTGSGTVTQTGGTTQATGVTAGSTPTPGTVIVSTDGGNITLTGGVLRGRTVSVTSTNGNIAQGGEHQITTDTNDATITSTNGTVTLGGIIGSAGGIGATAGGDLSLNAANLTSGSGRNVALASTGGNVILDADTNVNMSGGTFSANANQTLTIDGNVGQGLFGRKAARLATAAEPSPSPGPSPSGPGNPDYATGTAGNGIVVTGTIATVGTGGSESTDENGIELTATGGDVKISGTLQALGGGISILANNGNLTFSGNAFGNGNLTAYGSSSLTLSGNANANNTLDLSTFGALTVSGSGSGNSFTATSYGSTLTVAGGEGGTGSLSAFGGFGTVSSLSSPDKTNGAMAVNGRVDVGAGEVDFTAGTTFDNDPLLSSITATNVKITAGTTATVQLSRFHYGGSEDPSAMSVTAQTIFASTDADSLQQLTPLTLTATGPITLTGTISVQTLQGGNLTISPNSRIDITDLNTTGPTGAVVVGDGSTFNLDEGTNVNTVGPITLDGSPTVNLNDSLTVAGGITATNATQAPGVNLSLAATLKATGSIALGAGFINGASGTTVSTGGTLTTTGDVTVSTLNAQGGFTVGTLSAGTITLNDLAGVAPANPPASVVGGDVSAYRFNSSMVNTFTLGRFTAGTLRFAGIGNLGQNPDAYSLNLNIKGNFGVGAGGVTGFVTGADFSGAAFPADSTAYNGASGGTGGAFTVTTTPNPAASPAPGPLGTISIQANGTATATVLNANGGAFASTVAGVRGNGGAGGTLALQAADALNVLDGATVTAAGGNYEPVGTATYTGGGVTGGSGGIAGLTAGTTLTLTGGTGTAGTTTGPLLINAPGGSVLRSTVGTGGAGGTVNLTGLTAVNLTNVLVNAAGGDVPAGTTVGDARGGTINVTSTGTSSPTATSLSLTGATLSAVNGASVSTTGATGTGGTITLLSQDASSAATPPPPTPPPQQTFAIGVPAAASGPTTPPAVRLSGSTVIASQEETYPVPNGSPSPTPAFASLTGGTINVTSRRTTGPGISVQDSSKLLALVDSRAGGAGGHVNLTTNGADIAVVGGSTVRASGANSAVTATTGTTGAGTITVADSTVNTLGANNTFAGGSTVSLSAGAINVSNSTVGADMLKMQAFGTNGTVVINGNSTLTAATQLRLYAGGANGSITFQGNNITLSTGALAGVLAAPTITIVSGTTVTVNGAQPIQVFTDNANYDTDFGGNGSQTGLFAGTAQPVSGPQPFSNAPPITPTPTVAVAHARNPAARGPAAPRLLHLGQAVLLVQPVTQTKATAVQNQAVLQSIAVAPNPAALRNRAGTPNRRNTPGRTRETTPVRPPARPGAAATMLR